jgi:hypothetical protein
MFDIFQHEVSILGCIRRIMRDSGWPFSRSIAENQKSNLTHLSKLISWEFSKFEEKFDDDGPLTRPKHVVVLYIFDVYYTVIPPHRLFVVF